MAQGLICRTTLDHLRRFPLAYATAGAGACREAYGFFWLWWTREPQVPMASLEVPPPMPAAGPILEAGAIWRVRLTGLANWLKN